MTHLRQIMLKELRRRNFAETTIRSYLMGLSTSADFIAHLASLALRTFASTGRCFSPS